MANFYIYNETINEVAPEITPFKWESVQIDYIDDIFNINAHKLEDFLDDHTIESNRISLIKTLIQQDNFTIRSALHSTLYGNWNPLTILKSVPLYDKHLGLKIKTNTIKWDDKLTPEKFIERIYSETKLKIMGKVAGSIYRKNSPVEENGKKIKWNDLFLWATQPADAIPPSKYDFTDSKIVYEMNRPKLYDGEEKGYRIDIRPIKVYDANYSNGDDLEFVLGFQLRILKDGVGLKTKTYKNTELWGNFDIKEVERILSHMELFVTWDKWEILKPLK